VDAKGRGWILPSHAIPSRAGLVCRAPCWHGVAGTGIPSRGGRADGTIRPLGHLPGAETGAPPAPGGCQGRVSTLPGIADLWHRASQTAGSFSLLLDHL